MRPHPALTLALLLAAPLAAAQPRTFTNPVIPGFYPDPSVVRVGEDYYLVTSSFEYFPGVPIFHSRDLVSWRQIGHVLERPSQLPLEGVAASDGIYATTIRHHAGTFYVVTTNVRRHLPNAFTNFVVTAKNPAGPWSEPHVLDDSYYRIDPSLFFDDDGRAWFTANRTAQRAPGPGQLPPPGSSHRYLTIQELDLATMKLVGKPVDIGEGHARNAYAPEAPHIYKRDGWYYLMIAEGGTFETHATTISRSKSVTGPYELFQGNPILTHRHLGAGLDIHSVGHADLVQTPQGAWWMVALGMRGVPGVHCCNLGRETFLVPVAWSKDGWPVVNPGVGRIRAVEDRPALPFYDPPTQPACDHFDERRLGLPWNFVRTPRGDFWSLERRPGHLRLVGKREALSGNGNPAYVGRRLQHPSWSARTRLEFRPREGERAGIAVRNGNQSLQLVRARAGGREVVRLLRSTGKEDRLIAEAPATSGPVWLKVECRRETEYHFSFAAAPERWQPVGGRVDGRLLGHGEGGSSFTGSYVGMYAITAGEASSPADFDWFEYKGE